MKKLTLYQIADGIIKGRKKLKNYNAKRINALYEEARYDLDIVESLLKMDTGFKAVYDPKIRKQVEALRFKELKAMNRDFESILGKYLKKASNKTPGKKDPVRIFWNIKDSASKLEDLHNRMGKIPRKMVQNAPRILLSRRLPALEYRLRAIEETLR